MISMKLSAAEAKRETMLCNEPDDGDLPKYPYGLTLNFDEKLLALLGITEMPTVGTVMQLTALVEVCGVSQYQNQAGEEKNLNLQITDMELAAGNAEPKPLANRIYG